jgi:calcium-dependent protein kinase
MLQLTYTDISPDLTNLYLKKDNIIKIKREIVTESYVILQTLGKGSYGSVKKVRHKNLGDIRAMKIVNKVRRTLSKEIEILRKISHPNIINIYEIFEDRKKYYIITEFCEGGELFEQITKKGFYNELEAAKIIKQILQAVNYLHQLNIVHRDIKPENIMLLSHTHNLDLKLIDFGTAVDVPKGKRLKKFIGTSYYIAPEVIMEDYDFKCDVWSCGIILYILLCGIPPFNGNSNKQIYNNIRFQKLYFSQDEWKGISKDAIELIKNMLNKNPENRFSAEECLNHKWFNILSDNNNQSSSNENKIQIIERMTRFVQENKFKQAVLQFIITHFNLKKEETYLRKIFKEFDKDDKGVISKSDFQEQIKSLYGDVISEEIINKIFKNIDLDNSGEISYNEFLTCVINDKKILTEDRLEKAFHMFDKDGNGMLSIEEIKGLFGGDEETWENILKEVDMNGDKNVDFNEFKILMLGLNPKDIGNIEDNDNDTIGYSVNSNDY